MKREFMTVAVLLMSAAACGSTGTPGQPISTASSSETTGSPGPATAEAVTDTDATSSSPSASPSPTTRANDSATADDPGSSGSTSTATVSGATPIAESLDRFVELFNAGAQPFAADVTIDRAAIVTGQVETAAGMVDGFFVEVDNASAYVVGVLDGDQVMAVATVFDPQSAAPQAPVAGTLMAANPLLSVSPQFPPAWQQFMSEGIATPGYSMFFPADLPPAHPVYMVVLPGSDGADNKALVASGPFATEDLASLYTADVLKSVQSLNPN